VAVAACVSEQVERRLSGRRSRASQRAAQASEAQDFKLVARIGVLSERVR
jgi:hypothetical protein